MSSKDASSHATKIIYSLKSHASEQLIKEFALPAAAIKYDVQLDLDVTEFGYNFN